MTGDDDDRFLTVLIDVPAGPDHVQVIPARVMYAEDFTLADYVACCVAVAPNASAVTFV